MAGHDSTVSHYDLRGDVENVEAQAEPADLVLVCLMSRTMALRVCALLAPSAPGEPTTMTHPFDGFEALAADGTDVPYGAARSFTARTLRAAWSSAASGCAVPSWSMSVVALA